MQCTINANSKSPHCSVVNYGEDDNQDSFLASLIHHGSNRKSPLLQICHFWCSQNIALLPPTNITSKMCWLTLGMMGMVWPWLWSKATPPLSSICSPVLHLIIETIQPLHSALLNCDTRLAVLQQRSFLYSGDTKSIAMQRGEIEIATARCWCRSEVRFWWRLRSSVSLRTIGCF